MYVDVYEMMQVNTHTFIYIYVYIHSQYVVQQYLYVIYRFDGQSVELLHLEGMH